MTRKRSVSAPVNAAGSPLPGEPAFLAVGKLRHPHGVHGEILMEVYTDFPERLQPGTALYLAGSEESLTLVKRRSHNQGLLLTFQGYNTPEEVGLLRNQVLYVHADDRPPLDEGEYYHHQLIDLRVTSDDGRELGVVTDILETGASDVLVIRPKFGPEVLIPVSDAFILGVDLKKGEITVHLIPGMLGEEQ
jgi:16S rRNA processing protein RimM